MEIKERLEELYSEHCFQTKIGNAEYVLRTFHKRSPGYEQSVKLLENLFSNFKLDVESVAFRYMGKDNTYAYARARQKVIKVSGPELRSSVSDQLIVFKQDGNDWKIWTTAILNIKYLD